MDGIPEPRTMMADIIGEPRLNADGPHGEEVIVNAVITQQGVHNGAYKNAEEIVKMAKFGDHRWICDSHPWTIVAVSPQDIKGYQDSVVLKEVDMTKTYELNGEEVTETIKAPQVTADLHVVKAWAPELYEDVVNKIRKAVSIGYWAQVYEKEGIFMGDPYREIESEILQDHTGILKPGETPACEYALLNNAIRNMRIKGVAEQMSAIGGQGGVPMTSDDPIEPEPENAKNGTPPKPAKAAETPAPAADDGQKETPEAPVMDEDMAKEIQNLKARELANTKLLAEMKAKVDAEEAAKVKELAVELANITGQKPEVYENMSLPDITSHLETATNASIVQHNELRGAGAQPLGVDGAKTQSNVSTWDPETKTWNED